MTAGAFHWLERGEFCFPVAQDESFCRGQATDFADAEQTLVRNRRIRCSLSRSSHGFPYRRPISRGVNPYETLRFDFTLMRCSVPPFRTGIHPLRAISSRVSGRDSACSSVSRAGGRVRPPKAKSRYCTYSFDKRKNLHTSSGIATGMQTKKWPKQ